MLLKLIILDHLDREGMRVIGTRLRLSTTDDFHQHVTAQEFLGQLELVCSTPARQLDRLTAIGANIAKATGELLHERTAAKEQLDVDLVVVHLHVFQVLEIDRHLATFHLEIEAGLAVSQLILGLHQPYSKQYQAEAAATNYNIVCQQVLVIKTPLNFPARSAGSPGISPAVSRVRSSG